MAKTIINGFTAEIDGDGESTWCHVSKTVKGKFYCDSLALLESGDGGEFYEAGINISEATIEKITEWAGKNGY